MSRIPSVELIGKNANNRDVTVRFDIIALPESDDAWVKAAENLGLSVDADKTRGNIVVGQHYGFEGLIKSYDSLETVLKARDALLTYLSEPEQKEALGRFLRKRKISVDDYEWQRLMFSGPYKTFLDAAEDLGLVPHGSELSTVINQYTDWQSVLESIKGKNQEYITTSAGIWIFQYRK